MKLVLDNLDDVDTVDDSVSPGILTPANSQEADRAPNLVTNFGMAQTSTIPRWIWF